MPGTVHDKFVRQLPPRELLPNAVRPAVQEYDALVERWLAAEAEVLGAATALVNAEDADKREMARAVRLGGPTDDLPEHRADAEKQLRRTRLEADALVALLREAFTRLSDVLADHGPAQLATVQGTLPSFADRVQDALTELNEAKREFQRQVALCHWWDRAGQVPQWNGHLPRAAVAEVAPDFVVLDQVADRAVADASVSGLIDR